MRLTVSKSYKLFCVTKTELKLKACTVILHDITTAHVFISREIQPVSALWQNVYDNCILSCSQYFLWFASNLVLLRKI